MSYLIKSPYVDERSTSMLFGHTDSESLFKKNLKELGSEWYWKDKEIIYKYNKYGYRMNKELEDVDFDNYYAFFGCSFCTGVGLPLEETYSYKIAQKANVDYVNAGIGGGSVDFVHINFVEMFSKAPKLPKKVIINWPELTRTCFWHNDSLDFYMANKDHSLLYWKDMYSTFISEQTHIENRFKTIRQSIQTMCELANVELFEMATFQSDPDFRLNHRGIEEVPMNPDYLSDAVDYYNIVYARDIIVRKPRPTAHPGIYFQDRVVERVLEND